MKRLRFAAAMLLTVGMAMALPASGSLQAVGPDASVAQMPTGPSPVTLKVTVVISRFNGEKKIGSLPFVLMVIPGPDRDHDGDRTSVQMGADVPVPTSSVGENKQPVMSWQYRSVGTNIVVSARPVDSGQFNLSLTVADSQVLSDLPEPGGLATSRLSRFQNFTSSSRLLLRDGQTIQYTAATDKTSGEVAKLDVTLNVIK